MEQKSIVSLRNINVNFDGEVILNNIDLDIKDKEFITLLGPSGCGKTTTLRIIGGFLEPDSGDVYYDGNRINGTPPNKRNVNTVFQKYALFPHLNVFDNVAFGLKLKKLPKAEIKEKVKKMLSIVDLKGYEKRSVSKLSGGQQQRVAIARALVCDPDIILLDDSFASVTTAVRWGRSIYLNIQKFIQFQLTINVVALFTALTGPFIGIEFPLTVTQMLWVNLIMDTFAALALASEPSYKEVMKKKPRGINDFIISKSMMANIFGVGLVFLAILLGILVYMNKDGIVSVYELSVFFTIFVMMQFWNMFNARTLGGNRSAFYKLKENRNFVVIAVLILVLQIIIIQFGGGFFRTEPLSLEHWAAIIAGTSMVLWIGELCRLFKRINENRQ